MLECDLERILIFESGKKVFGLELDRVDSIVEKNSVTSVPNAPPAAEGVVFYRDRILPVFNLLKMLYGNNDGCGNLLLVVRGLSEDFCIPLDQIYGLMPLEQLKLRRIPSEERENPFIQGNGEFNGTEFFLLDFKI
jgi:chemotaxis signal transduction protein